MQFIPLPVLTAAERREVAIHAPMGPGLAYPDTRVITRPGWYQVITPSAPRGTFNEVVSSQVDAEDVERVIDDTVEQYRVAKQPVKWCVGPWTEPKDFGDRLLRRGFASWNVRGMGWETSRHVKANPEVRTVEIQAAQLDDYLRVQSRGWNADAPPTECDRELYAAAL